MCSPIHQHITLNESTLLQNPSIFGGTKQWMKTKTALSSQHVSNLAAQANVMLLPLKHPEVMKMRGVH